MKTSQYLVLKIITICVVTGYCRAKIMRNNKLMTKMISHFHKDVNWSEEPSATSKPAVISMMQQLLCKNFPSIPCSIIIKDEMLTKLIEKSVRSMNGKVNNVITTRAPYRPTSRPVFNSEDISNFVQVDEPDKLYSQRGQNRNLQANKRSRPLEPMDGERDAPVTWSREQIVRKKKVSKNNNKASLYAGRKRIKKVYPHKLKYKDKRIADKKAEYHHRQKDDASISVEPAGPEHNIKKKMDFEPDRTDPIWRIDYMKHGEPNLNVFGYENDALKGKIMKTNMMVDETGDERSRRRDMIRTDMYIKNNMIKKNSVEYNSENADK